MKVRIGKNIKFTWTLTYNDEVVDLSTHQVQVEITTPKRTKIVITPNVEGNVLTFEYKGKSIGAHFLTCYIDRYTLDETVCDYKDPFYLVEKSWMEEDSQEDDLQTEFINIEGNVVAAYLYEAGDNITIEGNVISATDTTYIAGENITIDDNVISATGGGATYTASSPLSIDEENNISINLSNYATVSDVRGKQDKYINKLLNIDTNIRWSGLSPDSWNVGTRSLIDDWAGSGMGISEPIFIPAGATITQNGTSGTMVVKVNTGYDVITGQSCEVVWVSSGDYEYEVVEDGWYCLGRHGSLIDYTTTISITHMDIEAYTNIKHDYLTGGNGIVVRGNTIDSTVTFTYDSATQSLNITTT